MPDLHSILLLLVIGTMVLLFLSEKLPYDLSALSCAMVLVLTGVIAPAELYAGVSSPPVITIFSTFIVAAAIRRTGVADWCAWRIAPWVGESQTRVLLVVTSSAVVTSAFMHNVAATALLLPPATSLARLARVAPSKVLLPLSFGTLLGGMTTLIGTTPHLVASELLAASGYEGFGFLDFTIVGGICALAGIVFFLVLGDRLLPKGDVPVVASEQLAELYRLNERFFSLQVPHGSPLAGRSLRELELGSILNVEVLAVERAGVRRLAPEVEFPVMEGDVLHLRGRLEEVLVVLNLKGWTIRPVDDSELSQATQGGTLVALRLHSSVPSVSFSVESLEEMGFFPLGIHQYGGVAPVTGNEITVNGGGLLFGLRMADRRQPFLESRGFSEEADRQERVLWLESPPSWEAEEPVRLALPRRAHFAVLGVDQNDEGFRRANVPGVLSSGGKVLVLADPRKLGALLALTDLTVSSGATKLPLENRAVCLLEVLIPPRSDLLGKTLPELDFRRRYGFQVVALWKEGRPRRTHFVEEPLEVGDALLLQGLRKRAANLLNDQNFLVLSELPQKKARSDKRPLVVVGFFLMLAIMISGLQPIPVAALLAAIWMIACGAVKTREAYAEVEWGVLLLIASILPMGGALVKTGVAAQATDWLIHTLVMNDWGMFGPYVILLVLAVIASLIAQALDSVLSIALLGPVAFAVSSHLGISVYPLMLGIALASSIAFLTPVSHKAHLLVVTPGGYHRSDFLRVGLPLSLALLVLVVVCTPFVFPF